MLRPLLPTVIVSLVQDEAWLGPLAELPVWQPPLTHTVVLAPHPDDETLGAGALIATLRAQGVPIHVVAATDGENAYNMPAAEREALGTLRETEQAAALAWLGVPPENIHRLRLTDSGLLDLVDQLTEELRRIVPPGAHLVAPWSGDFHPDHVACARAAETVAQETGSTLTSYFFWTWHRGTPDLLEGLGAQRFVPNAAALQAKAEALRCHESQLHHVGEEGPILPPDLLGPVSWPYEIYLPASPGA